MRTNFQFVRCRVLFQVSFFCICSSIVPAAGFEEVCFLAQPAKVELGMSIRRVNSKMSQIMPNGVGDMKTATQYFSPESQTVACNFYEQDVSYQKRERERSWGLVPRFEVSIFSLMTGIMELDLSHKRERQKRTVDIQIMFSPVGEVLRSEITRVYPWFSFDQVEGKKGIYAASYLNLETGNPSCAYHGGYEPKGRDRVHFNRQGQDDIVCGLIYGISYFKTIMVDGRNGEDNLDGELSYKEKKTAKKALSVDVYHDLNGEQDAVIHSCEIGFQAFLQNLKEYKHYGDLVSSFEKSEQMVNESVAEGHAAKTIKATYGLKQQIEKLKQAFLDWSGSRFCDLEAFKDGLPIIGYITAPRVMCVKDDQKDLAFLISKIHSSRSCRALWSFYKDHGVYPRLSLKNALLEMRSKTPQYLRE